MVFWRKKKMVDIRELQKSGRFPIPKEEPEISTNAEGFVEVGQSPQTQPTSQTTPTPTPQTSESSGSFLNFMDNPATPSQATSQSLTPTEDLKKLSTQISDLDNKLYKLEQRLELIERKVGVGSGY